MQKETKYLAKYNKVWQHIKSDKIIGNELALTKGEKLTDYRQVPKPADKSIDDASDISRFVVETFDSSDSQISKTKRSDKE